MGGRGAIGRSAYVAAFLAVVLFSFATVRSVVMQAAMAAPAGLEMPVCGHAGQPATAPHAPDQGNPAKACAYCAAASHAPVCTQVLAVGPSRAVAWTAYAALSPLGPRGPPEVDPRSRAPPIDIPSL